MNFTQLAVTFIIAVMIVSCVNVFAGDMFNQYNTTGNLGMYQNGTDVTGGTGGYIGWVHTMTTNTQNTVQKTPQGILSQIFSGIFWVLDSIVNFLAIIPVMTGMVTSMQNQVSATNLIQVPNFVVPLIGMMIAVAVTGYLLYLLIGNGGDNQGSI